MQPESSNALPTVMVIFGASGDLARRKLIPALFSLYRKGRLPAGISILGFARQGFSTEEFRERLKEGVEKYGAGHTPAPAREKLSWEDFAQRIWYLGGDFNNPSDFQRLKSRIEELEVGPSNRLYYLATIPTLFPTIVQSLGKLGMAHVTQGWRRIIVEKPFGRDLASARALNRIIHDSFQEHQVYRIDHYLGKETAQNILFFRFANTIFEPIWNRNYIGHVQITVAETVDVGTRGGYYDQAGVLRDMFQNHLLQLMSLVAMEPPASFEADAVRNEKVKLLSAIRPVPPERVAESSVRGQYEGYRQTPGVATDSDTATYAAIRLFVDNWRWQGVPFYLRSGKAMADKMSQINIEFQCPPHMMFPLQSGMDFTPNQLTLCIQPHEGMHLRFEVKIPDTVADMRSVNMNFHYEDAFGPGIIPDAYERLLVDALHGEASLFARADGIEKSWQVIDPFIRGWMLPTAPPLNRYQRGSWGPPEADRFIAGGGTEWMHGCTDEED